VLQCVAVHCSALQCVRQVHAVIPSLFLRAALLQCVAVCVAARCSALQCVENPQAVISRPFLRAAVKGAKSGVGEAAIQRVACVCVCVCACVCVCVRVRVCLVC